MSDVIKNVLAKKQLADLVPEKPQRAPLPELTPEKVEAAVELLKEVEKNNGHIAIAHKVGLTQKQVASIHRRMDERIVEIKKENQPKEEKVV